MESDYLVMSDATDGLLRRHSGRNTDSASSVKAIRRNVVFSEGIKGALRRAFHSRDQVLRQETIAAMLVILYSAALIVKRYYNFREEDL